MKKIIFIIVNVFVVIMCCYILTDSRRHLVMNDWPIKIKSSNDTFKSISDEKLTIKKVKITSASMIDKVLEKQVGTLSAYGPDCRGCSGHLGGGFDASGGNYTYNDSKYGEVRIVAGDSKYPYGTIVKVKNSKIGDFNAIVLDRGGAIGIGKRFMFDLLFPTEVEAAGFGTSYNIEFEILRYGY